jgi:hypothetical protein
MRKMSFILVMLSCLHKKETKKEFYFLLLFLYLAQFAFMGFLISGPSPFEFFPSLTMSCVYHDQKIKEKKKNN